ncbi:alpha/beta hydrolase family protein [Phaeocystidibacter marisrubri]|uniref:DUF676 domain-containing protein n=1 Tax=Phaeocystidibacter marisrubri TaxID=1577780 RepID=A0A6L3ZFK8_9FLAO|nr:hypothetical protein [Phaeocystidibacter marisrubri]KAB2815689.1 hypothetical protein F8C82_08280 [Phaeocystidibacter marisrubri]GGH65196.1 hypothetical protein GCM10011318_01960 [Phaeocystidibacter marisrubri]
MKYTVSILSFFLTFTLQAQFTVIQDSSLSFEDPLNENTQPITFSTPPDTTIPKLVFWVHGLAGDVQSWNRVQASTENQTGNPIQGYPERITEGLAVDYSGRENLRIFQLGSFVNNNIMEQWRVAVARRDTLPVSKNFAIAHSQGGIVLRAIRYNNLHYSSINPSQFGAFATFDSPHGGAYIINSTRPSNGDVQKWIEEGCRKLTAAKLTEIRHSKWYLNFLLTSDVVQKFAKGACSGFEGLVLPIIVDAIRKPVGQDYAVGAPSLSILNTDAQSDTMKVVTIAGVEEEPVFWRVLHTMTYTSDTSLSGSMLFNDPFSLNEDDEMTVFINSLILNYKFKRAYYQYLYDDYWNMVARGVIPIWQSRYGLQDDANTFKHAYQFLGSANLRWKRFIGARRDTILFNNTYTCRCSSRPPYVVNDPAQCGTILGTGCMATPNFNQIVVEEPNDGVVTLASQLDYPGALAERMEKTNHMQARNCDETKAKLNLLFNGRRGKEFRLYRR